VQGTAHSVALLGVGLTVGIAYGVAEGPRQGLAFGLLLGLLAISTSPWPRYGLACLVLAVRRDAPLRLARFLDWAYAAGLMRLSGTAVQFRHRELQAWLSTMQTGTD
jgi:hypothetical protein